MATWAERQRAPANGKGQADYAAGNGLWLRVFASGKRVWFIRGRVRQADGGQGKPCFVQLGDAAGMLREDADIAAAKARDLLRKGINPNDQRDDEIRATQAASKTFGQVVAEWTEDKRPSWRANTTEARRILFNGEKFKPWLDRPIASITARELKQHESTINQNSQQAALGPLRSVFKFATEQGYLERSTFTTAGVKVKRAEGNASPLVEFHEGRAPDFTELVAVLDAFDTCEQSMPLSPWWNIWRVCVATGQRPSAVIGMQWKELALDGDAPTWILQPERSKIKRVAVIPLSMDCAEILKKIPRSKSDLVWPGRDGKKPLKYPEGEPKMVNGILAARGFPIGWKPGRARDSVASWLEFQPDATERAMAVILNHKPPADNTRRKHYAKIGASDQARALLERWAAAVRDARSEAASQAAALRQG